MVAHLKIRYFLLGDCREPPWGREQVPIPRFDLVINTTKIPNQEMR